MTTETNPILLLGAKESGKSHIISSIFPNSTSNQQDDNTQSHQITLDTKYYSAQIEFFETSLEKFGENASLREVAFQAIVLVVDSLAHLEQIQDEFLDGKETRILVLNQNGRRQIFTEGDVVRCREWCIERGVEFMKYPYVAEGEHLKPAEDDDEDATDRLRNALECSMWCHMTRKAPTFSKRPVEESGSSQTTTSTATQSKEKPAQETTSTTAKSIDPQQDLIRQMFSQATGDLTPNVPEDHPQDDDRAIAESDAFESLLHKMMNLKTQGHMLDHEERKERAGQLIVQLMSMWGDEGDEEGEDSDELSSSSDTEE